MFIEKSDSFLELPSEVIFPEAANAALLQIVGGDKLIIPFC